MQGYKGYRLPPGEHADIDVVAVSQLDPQTFWARYVSQRKPVLIKGHLTDAGWKATAKWDNRYLKRLAGDAPLRVEKREGPGASYGQGRKQAMTFGKFLDRMAAGDDTLYLTTQQVALGADGHPELMGHPLLALRGDFEPLPRLAGHLVPQQINLWMGVSADGASSGLHHDFHDNLYVLMRGRKRFRLFDPSMAPCMYTLGTVRQIHPNGRIVYQGQGEVLADGSAAKDVELWRRRAEAERELAAAEADARSGVHGAAARVREAEAKLEAVLEEELDAALEGVDEDEDEEEEDEEEAPRRAKAVSPTKGNNRKSGEGDVGSDGEAPPSFSHVDLSLPEAEIARRFPRFPEGGAAAALECVVEPGCMLYLPAGWFHEVTSFDDAPRTAAQDGGHMALNYWFHPPDNLDPSDQGFHKPYTSDYLPSLWRERAASGEVGAEAGSINGHGKGQARRQQQEDEGAPGPSSGGEDEQAQVRRKDGKKRGKGKRKGQGTEEGEGVGQEAPGSGQGRRKRQAGRTVMVELSRVGADAAGDGDGDGEGFIDFASLSDEQKQQLHNQISALLMQQMGSAGRGGAAAQRRPREFRAPGGRRHHAVMYVPRKSADPRAGKGG